MYKRQCVTPEPKPTPQIVGLFQKKKMSEIKADRDAYEIRRQLQTIKRADSTEMKQWLHTCMHQLADVTHTT